MYRPTNPTPEKVTTRRVHYDLDLPILNLSPKDVFTARHACTGTFITGSSSSGKTSTAGKTLAHSYLLAGWGGLVLTAKREETQTWIDYAKETGREDDLIIFSAEGDHVYDPIFYEFNRPGRGANDLESIIDMFSCLLGIGRQRGHSSEPFWDRAAEQLQRNAIALLARSKQSVSISAMSEVIDSMPTRLGQHTTEEWQHTSFCAQVINEIAEREATLSKDDWSDLKIALYFIKHRWPSMDERPRSSVYMTFSGMADKFLYQPLNRKFCGGSCSFTPEDATERQKIVVVDFPLLEYGLETGRLINCLMKLSFTRAWLRRDVNIHPVPVFLWQDEGQYFLLSGDGGASRDNQFAQVCRSARVATVFLTQNVLNVAEQLSEDSPGARTRSLLANYSNRFFFRNDCTTSNELAADLIGKEYKKLRNTCSSAHDVTIGLTEHREHILAPETFTGLSTPDLNNPTAECIAYQGGKIFDITRTKDFPQGRNHLRMSFSRL